MSSIQSGYGTKNYSYDEIGNMLTKDGKSYTYGNGNHQVTADGTHTYLYDANGNMMSRKQGSVVVQSYTYNFDNMIKDVDEGGNLSHYSYFDGQRVRKEKNGIITRYFFPEYEEEEDTNISQTRSIKYYFANNQRIARVDSINGLAYYHQDHLGSSTRMTNISQSLVRSQGYKPYGQDSYSSGSAFVKYKFTGKEEDTTGLYYYEARYYDPSLGRFLQADTIVPDPGDPQSYNRYTYVRNNPIKYTDPTGHSWWDDFKDDLRKFFQISDPQSEDETNGNSNNGCPFLIDKSTSCPGSYSQNIERRKNGAIEEFLQNMQKAFNQDTSNLATDYPAHVRKELLDVWENVKDSYPSRFQAIDAYEEILERVGAGLADGFQRSANLARETFQTTVDALQKTGNLPSEFSVKATVTTLTLSRLKGFKYFDPKKTGKKAIDSGKNEPHIGQGKLILLHERFKN